MRHVLFATALLIAPLAACGSEEASKPADSAATETTTQVAVVNETPSAPLSAGQAPATAATPADADTCGASKLDRWLNVLPTDDVKAEIAETVGERPIRYYTQGDPITMDFSEARLNVELGPDGRIKLFRCG